jgi:hypothetical protein
VSAKVLVAEKIGASGIDLLREHFDVDTAFDTDGFDLEGRLGEYDGILIRSATKMTADLIEKGERLRVIGRAGVGVDNVDVPAATKRGIVVVNAPQSNVVTAAEHTMGMLLAVAATSRRRTWPSSAATGPARGSAASSSWARPSGSSASAASASSSPPGRGRSTWTSSPSTRTSPPSATASSASRRRRRATRSTRARTS